MVGLYTELFLKIGTQCETTGWYLFNDDSPIVLCTECEKYKTEEFAPIMSCSSWQHPLSCSKCDKPLNVAVYG